MRVEVKVPQLPESVAEATLVSWHKQAGQAVKRLVEVLKGNGSTVAANEVIAILDTATKAEAAPAAAAAAPPAAPAAAAPATAPAAAPAAALPAARKMMAEQGLAAGDVAGTGRGGRVTKGDVLAAAEAKSRAAPVPAPAAPVAPAPRAPAVALPASLGNRPEQRVPMSRLRQRVAERLVQSQSTAAILTTFNEVNMQPVIELRNRYKDRFEKEHGVKLGFMGFFVKAAVHALKKYPLVIEKQIADFGKRAQEGKLTVDELTGGTYTISNGGVFGSMLSTPIINPPQSAILGVHATKDRAVVENGQVVVRPMNYLAQSYDHRIIDGREAVLSLVAIKEALEDPARLLLDL